MALVTIERVGLTYGERPILRDVSLVIGGGERVGLVGPNGSGKSTLLRVLAGVEVPDSGSRTTRRDLRVGWLEQDPALPAETSVRDLVRGGLVGRESVLAELDAVHAGLAAPDLEAGDMEQLLARQERLETRLETLGGHHVEHRVEAMIGALGLPDPDAPCGALSGGERRRVALARLLLSEPEFLLLDEPTNHLDAEVVAWFEDHLGATRAAFVLVTHDRYFLDRVVERVLEIDCAAVLEYRGGYEGFLVGRAERLARQGRAESTRLNLLRRETAWMRRGPPARTSKSKTRIERYQALRDTAPEPGAGELEFRIPCATRLGDRVLQLEGVRKSFGELVVLDGVDLELGRGERLGVIGPNGAGKTTLVRICMGLLEPDEGCVQVGPTVRFSFIDQQRSDLDDARTVVEEVGRGNDHVPVGGRMLRIESFLESFLFPSSMLRTRVGDLSGGERNRVLIAKLLATAGNVLVLDEPTNDLDLMTLRVLEEALLAFEGTVVIVSHDRWMLDRVATRILHLGADGHARHWAGDLSALLEQLRTEREARRSRGSGRPAAAAGPRRPSRSRAPKLSWHDRQELDALPDRISEVEARLARIDERLADPGLYQGDRGEVNGLGTERAEVSDELNRLYARWEELEELDG